MFKTSKSAKSETPTPPLARGGVGAGGKSTQSESNQVTNMREMQDNIANFLLKLVIFLKYS